MRHPSTTVVAMILSFIGIGLVVNYFTNSRAPLVFGVIAAAIITFFWLLFDVRGASGQKHADDRDMRRAIAGSVVVEYLILVGLVSFYEGGSAQLSPITQALIANFTTVVGVVIAFYLGSSAYLEAQNKKHRATDERTSEKDKDSTATR